MLGKVKKYFYKQGYGFILGNDGNTYFVHCSNLNGEHIEKGYYVYFKPFKDKRSVYNAKDVVTVESVERYGRRGKVHK
jgi:cold shock CspA family protein